MTNEKSHYPRWFSVLKLLPGLIFIKPVEKLYLPQNVITNSYLLLCILFSIAIQFDERIIPLLALDIQNNPLYRLHHFISYSFVNNYFSLLSLMYLIRIFGYPIETLLGKWNYLLFVTSSLVISAVTSYAVYVYFDSSNSIKTSFGLYLSLLTLHYFLNPNQQIFLTFFSKEIAFKLKYFFYFTFVLVLFKITEQFNLSLQPVGALSLGGIIAGLLFYHYWTYLKNKKIPIIHLFSHLIIFLTSLIATTYLGFHLGFLYDHSKIIERQKDECQKNNYIACTYLWAKKQYLGSAWRSINYVFKTCNPLNKGDICYHMGLQFIRLEEYQKSILPLTKSCNENNALACSDLGYSYAEIKQIYLAKDVALKSCRLGDGLGCFNYACYICEINPKDGPYALGFIISHFSLIEKGNHKDSIETDPDLECVRKLPEYQEFKKKHL